jgi:hypothetical protein
MQDCLKRLLRLRIENILNGEASMVKLDHVRNASAVRESKEAKLGL